MYARKILLNNLTIGFSYWNYYYQSGNYIADMWEDVAGWTFSICRKGKRPFGFDEYVRDHKDLLQEAKEDVAFFDKYPKSGKEWFE